MRIFRGIYRFVVAFVIVFVMTTVAVDKIWHPKDMKPTLLIASLISAAIGIQIFVKAMKGEDAA